MEFTSEGLTLITGERIRQVAEEGWTARHDDGHVDGELAMAAACYAAPFEIFVRNTCFDVRYVDPWPWDDGDKRPRDEHGQLRTPTREERIRMLAKAGALCAAEIDRLLRLG